MYVIGRDDMNIFNSIKVFGYFNLTDLSLSLPSISVTLADLKTPDIFFKPQDDGSHIFPSYVAPNKYGKCVTIVHTKFPVMLVYGCSSV
jgi:hypothetical protein